MTAVVAYAPPIFFSNFFSLICISHIANINSIDMLSSVADRPLKSPVLTINAANKKPAFVGLAKVQLVSFEIHFTLVVIIGFLSALFGMKYPGNHNMSKANGIEQMIFHNGMFIVRARKKHAHRPMIVTPNTYNANKVKHMVKIIPPIIPTGL